MLHDFLTANRTALITRCRNKAAKRLAPTENLAAFEHGVPLFLQQLVETLRLHKNPTELGPTPVVTAISRTAGRHGFDLLLQGYSIEQVVRDYGDVCQAVTELASEQSQSISTDEFHIFNRCLDDAIAEAVTAFGRVRKGIIDVQAETLQQRLSAYSDQHHQLVGVALHALVAINTGQVGLKGSTGTLLMDTLEELHSLAVRNLPEIRPEFPSSPVVLPTTTQ
jgi:hypothetical protein